MNDQEIVKGSEVTLHYTLKLADGRTVETSREAEPVTLVVGAGDFLAAFEQRLIGLRVGDHHHFDIPCGEAYGETAGEDIHVLPRDDFPPDMMLEPGLVIAFETPSGAEAPGVVTEVTEHEVSVNFTHPLAGHDLAFVVEILAVKSPDKEIPSPLMGDGQGGGENEI
jgi:FKBP-type peptidyl-prolyl cis-trans isomerase SlpA